MSLSWQSGSVEEPDILQSDEGLARSIAAGDTTAWGLFYDRYSTWVFRFAYHHLNRNHADAEDLCSDILMTAAGSIGEFDATRGSLDAWLLGLARHRLARFCRRRRLEAPLVPEMTDADSAKDERSLERFVEDSLTSDAVNRALFSIPERQASALIGKYVEGYSTEELARITDMTPKAVESLLSRGRAGFRSAYNKLLRTISGGDSHG